MARIVLLAILLEGHAAAQGFGGAREGELTARWRALSPQGLAAKKQLVTRASVPPTLSPRRGWLATKLANFVARHPSRAKLKQTRNQLLARWGSLARQNVALKRGLGIRVAGAPPPPTAPRGWLFRKRALRAEVDQLDRSLYWLEHENQAYRDVAAWRAAPPHDPDDFLGHPTYAQMAANGLAKLHEVDGRFAALKALANQRGFGALRIPGVDLGSRPSQWDSQARIRASLMIQNGVLGSAEQRVGLGGHEDHYFGSVPGSLARPIDYATVSDGIDRLLRDAQRLSPREFRRIYELREQQGIHRGLPHPDLSPYGFDE